MEDYFAFESGVTSQGLRVYVKHVEVPRPQVVAGLMAFAGFRQSPQDGISHALEHAVAAADGVMPMILGKQRFAREHRLVIEDFGETNTETVFWRVRSAPEQFGDALRFLHGMARVMPTEFSLDGLKEVLQREFVEMRNPDREKIDRIPHSALVPDTHPMLSASLETPETIAALTKERLLEHWQRYYTLPNMTLVVAGSVTLADAIAAAEVAFSAMSHDAGATRDEVQPIIAQQVRSGELVVSMEDVLGDKHRLQRDPLMRLFRVLPARTFHCQQNDFVMNVINGVCFRVLREERKILYGVNIGMMSYRDLDYYEVEAMFGMERREECASTLRHLPELVKEHGRKEFEMQKCGAVTKLALSDYSLRELQKGSLMEVGDFGRILTHAEQLRVLEEITFDDVVRCVEELFSPDKSLFVTILP